MHLESLVELVETVSPFSASAHVLAVAGEHPGLRLAMAIGVHEALTGCEVTHQWTDEETKDYETARAQLKDLGVTEAEIEQAMKTLFETAIFIALNPGDAWGEVAADESKPAAMRSARPLVLRGPGGSQ